MSDLEYISKDAFVTQQRKQYCENCDINDMIDAVGFSSCRCRACCSRAVGE